MIHFSIDDIDKNIPIHDIKTMMFSYVFAVGILW